MKKLLNFFIRITVMLMAQQQIFAEISKEKLFSTPSFISAKVSPDGKTIAYVGADGAGIPNVFVRSRDAEESSQLTFFTTPYIVHFYWSPKSDKILFLKDEDGTARLNLHGVDIRTQEQVVYTEKFPGVNAKVFKVGKEKNSAVIGLNLTNPSFHDLYRLDLDSGDLTLLLKNEAYASFLISDDLKIMLKMRINDDGSWTILTEDDTVFMEIKAEDAFQTEFISYDAKNQGFYLLDNRFTDTNRLVFKPLSGKEEVLGGQDDSDVDEVLMIGGEPKAYATYYTQKKWHILDASIADDISFLESHLGPNFEVINQSEKGGFWIVANSIPHEGDRCYLYDRKNRHLLMLHSEDSTDFSKMYPLVVETRDGKKLVCYYTLPKEVDKGGTVETPIPLIVMPHGGPFKVRDKFEFDPYHQWLASCGYAALSVNFRLSSGFGKEFVNAGNGEWGGKAHLDIIDAIEGCIAKGIAQRGKLSIVGGSYGGYEALTFLTLDPDYFACCVSICGPSNLKTVLDNVPKFWECTAKPLSDQTRFFTKSAFITSMGGDPDQEEGIKYLQKCSPLNFLDGIKVPLMLMHGQNDHIVAEVESRQIYESMKKNGKEVVYILFPDEGHGFAKFPNKMLHLDQTELFLSQHLGGKYRPVDKEILDRSSAKFSK